MVKYTYAATAMLACLGAPTLAFMTTSQVRMTGVARDAFFRLNSNSSLSGPDNWLGVPSEVSRVPTTDRSEKKQIQNEAEKPIVDDLLAKPSQSSSIAGQVEDIETSSKKVVIEPTKKSADGVVGAFLWLAIALGGAMVVSSPEFSLVDLQQLTQLDVSKFSGIDLSHLSSIELPQIQSIDLSLPQIESVDWSKFESVDFTLPNIENVELSLPEFENIEIPKVDFSSLDLSSGAALSMANFNLDNLDISASMQAVGEYHWQNLAWARELGDSISSNLGLTHGVSPLQAVAQSLQDIRSVVMDSLSQENLMKTSLSVSSVRADLANQAHNVLQHSQQSFVEAAGRFASAIQPDHLAASLSSQMASASDSWMAVKVEAERAIADVSTSFSTAVKVETERSIGDVSGALVGIRQEAISRISEFRDGVPAFVSAVSDGARNAESDILNFAQSTSKSVGEVGSAIPRLVHDVAISIDTVTSQVVGGAKDTMATLRQDILSQVSQIREGIPVFVEAARDGFDNFVQGMMALVEKAIQSTKVIAQDAKSFVLASKSRAQEDIPQVVPGMRSTIAKLSDSLTVWTEHSAEQMQESLTAMEQNTRQLQSSMTHMSLTGDMAKTISDRASELAKSVPQTTLPAMGDLQNSVATKVGDAMASVPQLSAPSVPSLDDVVGGVGIEDMIENVKSKAAGIQESLVQASTPDLSEITNNPQFETVDDVSAAASQLQSAQLDEIKDLLHFQ